jgi:hypothetical protein
MHNLHFIVIKANSGEEACQEAENLIDDYGNENNWRTMCGAVSQDNEVYDAGDGRYQPSEKEYITIEKINEVVNSWAKETFYGETARKKFEKGETNLDEWNQLELWSLSKYADHLSETIGYKNKSFNVLEDTLFEYSYDQCGVTNFTEVNASDGDKTWVVFCDMHS